MPAGAWWWSPTAACSTCCGAPQGLPLHGPRECDIPNTGINRLRWTGNRLQIVRWAEADHLAGLPEQPSTAQLSVPDEA